MLGLVPGIQYSIEADSDQVDIHHWMAGTSPAMTGGYLSP
jgi:hypothetical protein